MSLVQLPADFMKDFHLEVAVDVVLSHTLRSAVHHFMKKLRLSCDATSAAKMDEGTAKQYSRQDLALTNCQDLLQKSRLSRQTFSSQMQLQTKHRH